MDELVDDRRRHSGWNERRPNWKKIRARSKPRSRLPPSWKDSAIPFSPGSCPSTVADDLIGGMARIAWRKFRPFVHDERERTGTQKSWEWFQWLAEQLDLHGASRTNLQTGAFIAYRDWKP